MEALRKALELRKAKYLKRTGSPGSYKYTYKEEARSRKRKGNIGVEGVGGSSAQNKAYNVLKGMSRDKLVDIIATDPKEDRTELMKESKPFLARTIVENMPDQVKKYSGETERERQPSGTRDAVEGLKENFEEFRSIPDKVVADVIAREAKEQGVKVSDISSGKAEFAKRNVMAALYKISEKQ